MQNRRRCLFTIGLILFVIAPEVYGQGYTIDQVRRQVVVGSRDHWEYWTFPAGTLEMMEAGEIRPTFVRRNINASLNAHEFVDTSDELGGIYAVGSNSGDAPSILDGDPETYWEPDSDDPLRDWWVEINLGRLVVATKIVLRFAEAGDGDPFNQFRVATSDGDRAFTQSKALDYRTIGRTTKPSGAQRVFEFDLVPAHVADWDGDGQNDTEGDAVKYVQVVVTDSDFGRAEQVTGEQYADLLPADRGDRVYFRRLPSGEEKLISEEGYEDLASELKGRVEYYRRERPRLAEVEVWTLGDNISLGIIDRRGSAESIGGGGAASGAIDGDMLTTGIVYVYNPFRKTGALQLDLGAKYWVDLVRITSKHGTPAMGAGQGDLWGYELRASDGSKAPDGSLLWDLMSSEDRIDNPRRATFFEENFPLRKVRYLNLRNIDLGVNWSRIGIGYQLTILSEVQVFGQGYLPEVTLSSPLIQLGGSRNINSIEWEADTPPGTRVELRTRTGDELREIKHFFDKSGNEVTEKRYNQLPKSFRGDVTVDYSPGSGWSSWTRPYRHSGDPITSPSPRKYLLLQATLLSDAPNLHPVLEGIHVNFVDPVAGELVAELWPDQLPQAGVPQVFSFYLKPNFDASSRGFDRILIESPTGAAMQFVNMRAGAAEAFLEGTETALSPDQLNVRATASDSILIELDTPIRGGGTELVAIDFESTVFLNGTTFQISAANASVADSWQRADYGDASISVNSQTNIVSLPIDQQIVGDVKVTPNPFTPNGDGVNDEIAFAFSVYKVNIEKPASVTIYNLAGRKVRELEEQRPQASGPYQILWDGVDDEGERVPPGLYIAQIGVDTDFESSESRFVIRTVGVAY